jgi:serine/threonine protein kinase
LGEDNLLENDQGGLFEQAGESAVIADEPTPPAEEKKTEAELEEEKKEERVGTPYYLSPELWKSNKCTKKSDIWALGVILYELCCFQYPFPASNLEELE